MNLEKYIILFKKIFNKYIKLFFYSFFVIILAITIYYTYNNVYKTAVSPDEIKESEITAKKQKVDVALFKEIENKIKSKNENSVKIIPNLFD